MGWWAETWVQFRAEGEGWCGFHVVREEKSPTNQLGGWGGRGDEDADAAKREQSVACEAGPPLRRSRLAAGFGTSSPQTGSRCESHGF